MKAQVPYHHTMENKIQEDPSLSLHFPRKQWEKCMKHTGRPAYLSCRQEGATTINKNVVERWERKRIEEVYILWGAAELEMLCTVRCRLMWMSCADLQSHVDVWGPTSHREYSDLVYFPAVRLLSLWGWCTCNGNVQARKMSLQVWCPWKGDALQGWSCCCWQPGVVLP